MLEFRGHRLRKAPPLCYVMCVHENCKDSITTGLSVVESWRHLEGFAFRARDAASRPAYAR